MKWRKKPPDRGMVARCICKDCRFWLGSLFATYGTCAHLPSHGKTIYDGFCYWGEKRKGGDYGAREGNQT